MFSSCKEDEIKGSVLYSGEEEPKGGFDLWLEENFMNPYNIAVIYKWKDFESDFTYHLSPCKKVKAEELAKIVKFMWIDAYNETTGNPDFMRSYCPKQIFMVGSPSIDPIQKGERLGVAEGGVKVTLYKVNYVDWSNMDDLNEYFLNTMHHEFAHILHQKKDYPTQDFDVISEGLYTNTGWVNTSYADAWSWGFVTPYASSATQEDFVETIARYVTYTDEDWEYIIDHAGTDGASKIQQKLQIARTYLLSKWDVDIDLLHQVVQRRASELPALFQ